MAIEKRSLSSELRASASKDSYELRGVAAAFNSLSKDIGGFREQIAPGAFTRSLKSGTDFKCLLNHSADVVLGRVANKTLLLEETKRGLEFRCQLNPASPQHQSIYESVKRGDISECSFGFSVAPNGDSFDNAKDERGQTFLRRSLKDIDLREISCVTWPAYNTTSVSARSFDYSLRTESASDAEWLEVLARVGNVGKMVEQDQRNLVLDAENLLRAAKLGDEVKREELRSKLARVREELGL